jgi:hypothetical protein
VLSDLDANYWRDIARGQQLTLLGKVVSGRGSYRRDALLGTPSITTSMAKRNRSSTSPATS